MKTWGQYRKDGRNAQHSKMAYKSQCFKTKTKVLPSKLLEGTMQETQSTLAETNGLETLTSSNLTIKLTFKIAIVIIITILSFLIKP